MPEKKVTRERLEEIGRRYEEITQELLKARDAQPPDMVRGLHLVLEQIQLAAERGRATPDCDHLECTIAEIIEAAKSLEALMELLTSGTVIAAKQALPRLIDLALNEVALCQKPANDKPC